MQDLKSEANVSVAKARTSLFSSSSTVKQPKQALLVLGAPGIGKSTQTSLILEKRPGLMAVSTGNLVRQLNDKVEKGQPLNEIEQKAALYLPKMKLGQLMDDEAVYGLLMAHLSPGGEGYERYLNAHTIILDGVIKAAVNIKPFEEALKAFNDKTCAPMHLTKVINMVANEEDLLARQKARVQKAQEKGEKQRPDDDLDIYKNRLRDYSNNNKEIIQYFEAEASFHLVEVDCSQGIEETTQRLVEAIEKSYSNELGLK